MLSVFAWAYTAAPEKTLSIPPLLLKLTNLFQIGYFLLFLHNSNGQQNTLTVKI